MKKLINDPKAYVDEALDGMVMAHPAHFARIGSKDRVVARMRTKQAAKVGIASGGGFGLLGEVSG